MPRMWGLALSAVLFAVGVLTSFAPVHAGVAIPCGFIGQWACGATIGPSSPGRTPDQSTEAYPPPPWGVPWQYHCQPLPDVIVNDSLRCALGPHAPTYPPRISAADDLRKFGISQNADISCPLYPQCLIIPDGTPGTTIPAGRYIYVVRANNPLQPVVLRRYNGYNPRSTPSIPPCYGYRTFDAAANFRAPGGAYSASTYQYVRHSQLAGTPDASVYGAGELLVQPDNVVVAISNDSGHFRPAGSSLSFVRDVFMAMGINVSPHVRLVVSPEDVGAESPCITPVPQAQFTLFFYSNQSDGQFYIDSPDFDQTLWSNAEYQPIAKIHDSATSTKRNSDTYWAYTPLSDRPPAHAPNQFEQPFQGFNTIVWLHIVGDYERFIHYDMNAVLDVTMLAPSERDAPWGGYQVRAELEAFGPVRPVMPGLCVTMGSQTPPLITVNAYDPFSQPAQCALSAIKR